jgi:hypothetical protein
MGAQVLRRTNFNWKGSRVANYITLQDSTRTCADVENHTQNRVILRKPLPGCQGSRTRNRQIPAENPMIALLVVARAVTG